MVCQRIKLKKEKKTIKEIKPRFIKKNENINARNP